ncbi:spore germination protein PC [Anoxybacillus calidus]|uniref:Spore germination protein PC n=1 Tax=[Anoxybacillus] calidus TaxID=575178 RepID=A0A7W0BVY7_9BACL|nr:spore germination protein GerPC [Anoxybacillus calidus]MBA2872050.1 spore germination protein PC [Anoxybacillus calidus]
MNAPFLYDYLIKLQHYLSWQTQKIIKLEKKIAELENELMNVRKLPQTTIEKIEYKFDQLKVETLEGTLNIGLTPNGTETIEDFAVSPEKVIIPQPQPIMFRNIQTKVNDYLTNECENILKSIEERYSQRLDDTYRQFILQDIGRQVDDRIRFYVQQKINNGQMPASGSSKEIEDEISEKVKRDIEQSIELFIKHLPKEG